MKSKNWIVTTPRGYVAREQIDKYRCRDYFVPLRSEYGNRITARGALVFDTMEEALAYVRRNEISPATITPYDVCRCCVCAEAIPVYKPV